MDDEIRKALENMSEEEFLVGPNGNEDDLDIDDIFAKTLTSVMADWVYDTYGEPHSRILLCRQVVEFPIDRTDYDGFFIATVPDPASGVAAVADGRVVGLYVGADLVVSDDHQGKGIGKTLVMERFLRSGWLPTWDLDTPAYTSAGEATHRAAYQSLRAQLRSSPVISP